MRNDSVSWGTSILCVVLIVGLMGWAVHGLASQGKVARLNKEIVRLERKLEVQMYQAAEELTSLEKDLQEHRSFLYELTE